MENRSTEGAVVAVELFYRIKKSGLVWEKRARFNFNNYPLRGYGVTDMVNVAAGTALFRS